MRIVVVVPGSLYPIQGMSQVRILNEIRMLARQHEVILLDMVTNPGQIRETAKQIKPIVVDYLPVKVATFDKGLWFKVLYYLYKKARLIITPIAPEEVSAASVGVRRQILRRLEGERYDALLIHYWYFGYLFSELPPRILKIIDTHYVVQENLENLDYYKRHRFQRLLLKRELRHSLAQERKYLRQADLVVVNSARQKTLIHNWDPSIRVNVTINGQDLAPYLEFHAQEPPKQALLFYGALSNQFNRMALERILSGILPQLRNSLPNLKLYVVGSRPPQDILGRYNRENVVVTGFVEDIRPVVTQCRVLLLPLSTGSGFRGRIVETMALGIPVVGTSNALQSIGFEDGREGFVRESDADMCERVLQILADDELYMELSEHCREFSRHHFSLEVTFGKLAELLGELER